LPGTREKHLEKKVEELVEEAKAKLAKNDKKGKWERCYVCRDASKMGGVGMDGARAFLLTPHFIADNVITFYLRSVNICQGFSFP